MPRPLTRRSPLAYHARRLGLTLAQVARITREPLPTIKNWSSGRHRPPRSVLRLLALYRLSRRSAPAPRQKLPAPGQLPLHHR